MGRAFAGYIGVGGVAARSEVSLGLQVEPGGPAGGARWAGE